MAAAKTRRYFVVYPRDFANEYTVYVVPAAETGRFLGLFPKAERVTRGEAVRLGFTRPKQARLSGESWGGKFAGAMPLDQSAEAAISECEDRTLEEMTYAEGLEAAGREMIAEENAYYEAMDS